MLSATEYNLSHHEKMDIGDLIRQKRKKLKLSQSSLAKMLKVNKSAVAHWELNATRPTEEHMAILKRILGIDSGSQASPTSPYKGKLVDDPDLLAWLDFLEMIPSDERRILAKHIMSSLTLPSKVKSA